MSDHDNDLGAFLSGVIIGGLVGAAAALLLAPQSGEETRGFIRDKSIELRDRASETAEEARLRAGEIATRVSERGHQIYDEQRERVTKAIDAGKNAAMRKKSEVTGDMEMPGDMPEMPSEM
jgi:gas vesicle protein